MHDILRVLIKHSPPYGYRVVTRSASQVLLPYRRILESQPVYEPGTKETFQATSCAPLLSQTIYSMVATRRSRSPYRNHIKILTGAKNSYFIYQRSNFHLSNTRLSNGTIVQRFFYHIATMNFGNEMNEQYKIRFYFNNRKMYIYYIYIYNYYITFSTNR